MEGTTDRQRCLRTVLGRLYEEATEQGFTSPAVIVVGAVAELQLTDGLPAAEEGEGIEGCPLAGVTVGSREHRILRVSWRLRWNRRGLR